MADFADDYLDVMSHQPNEAYEIMTSQFSRSAEAEDETLKLGPLKLFAIFGLPVILGFVLSCQIANRWVAFEVEEGPDGTSVSLLSPFGTFPLRKTAAGNGSLLLAVYPNSIPEEQASFDWMLGPGTIDQSQLTIIIYESGTSLEKINSWYQKRLETSFTRAKGWSPAENQRNSAWMQRVESRARPEAIMFYQELPHRVRGILLLPGSAGQNSQIILYDYMDSSGK